MKAMRNINMNRMLGSLKRKPARGTANVTAESSDDTPEANAARSVRSFCESGGPSGSGEEVLYLPTIVESAESSPSAAKECAHVICTYLGKDNFTRPYVQYNGIMLIRILADNPGRTFTRNIDSKFVQTVKEMLKLGRDPSVKQLLVETLDTFQREKADDEGLAMLIEMWKKERERMGPAGPSTMSAFPFDPNTQNYFSRNHHSRRLPNPHELSSRIEEARNSAKLLSQVVQSTPPSELLQNDLVREFVDRCQSASRSIQAYIIAEDPAPDNNTMETLIETNEQLSKAMNQHQRAILNARKVMGLGSGEAGVSPPAETESGFAAPPGPPSSSSNPSSLPRKPIPIPPPGEFMQSVSDDERDSNPFTDSGSAHNPSFSEDRRPVPTGQFDDGYGVEPYHPGFQETHDQRQGLSAGEVTNPAGASADREDGHVVASPQRSGSNRGGRQAPIYRY